MCGLTPWKVGKRSPFSVGQFLEAPLNITKNRLIMCKTTQKGDIANLIKPLDFSPSQNFEVVKYNMRDGCCNCIWILSPSWFRNLKVILKRIHFPIRAESQDTHNFDISGPTVSPKHRTTFYLKFHFNHKRDGYHAPLHHPFGGQPVDSAPPSCCRQRRNRDPVKVFLLNPGRFSVCWVGRLSSKKGLGEIEFDEDDK